MTTKERLEEIAVVIKAIGLTPKLQYTENQTAQILGISTASLWRMRKEGIGLDYKKRETNSKSNNGRVMYPLSAIADYYFNNIRTA